MTDIQTIKAFVAIPVEKELPKDNYYYNTNEGPARFDSNDNRWHDQRNKGNYANPDYWLKEISLIELMENFETWKQGNFKWIDEDCYVDCETDIQYNHRQLLNRFLTREGYIYE